MSVVSFVRKDENFPDIKQASEDIANFLLKNEELIEVFCDALIGVNTSSYSITRRIAECIMGYSGMYPEHGLIQLKELMENYYMYIDDMAFDNKLRQLDRYYTINKMYLPQNKLNKLRGILFESLIEKLVIKRYKNFGYGCTVCLNSVEITSIYEGKIRKTVDVAGFDDIDTGEFYECKITPNSLDEKSYLYLDVLENALFNLNDIKYVVGCVSAGTLAVLNAKKYIIESTLGKSNNRISLFGIDELIELNNRPSKFNMAV